MKPPRNRFSSLTLALSLMLALGGCANIGDPMGIEGGGSGNNPDNPDDPEETPLVCLGDGGAGGACVVTGDCDAPLVCLGGSCVGPKDPDVYCDDIEGIACKNANEVCVANLCVINPGSCTSVDECPNGFACTDGTCTPERDGGACADPGPGPNLAGTWKFDSVLHLRDALPSVIDKLLNASGDARDILNGNIDLDLPSLVEDVIGGLVASYVRQYVPNWAQELIDVLGQLDEILDDMRVKSTVTLEGQECSGHYRGKDEWTRITFNLNGREITAPPSALPGVDSIIPDEFNARYSCGQLYIDKHTIEQSMSGLLRWLLDIIAVEFTGYATLEEALVNIIDCYSLAVTLDNYVGGVCPICPVIYGIVNAACEGVKSNLAAKIGAEIDAATEEMGLVKRKGVGDVLTDTTLEGQWYGTLVGGDFPGEFTATKQ